MRPAPQDDPTFLEFVEKAVDAALQAHKSWTPELSDTIGEIVTVATELTHAEDYKRAIVTHGKLRRIDKDALFRALAIYKQVMADLFGMTLEQVEEKINSYAVKK